MAVPTSKTSPVLPACCRTTAPNPSGRACGWAEVYPLIQSIRSCDMPAIAIVNGDAAAGGCDLALACDTASASSARAS
ncbi:MAG: enoyl-CoA hydratase-related protein [Aquabacterium sp.]|nr:enoyl-CoA hydratase-related protein [Aquabacterium sp.]